MSFLIVVPIVILFEIVTRVSATLRPRRGQLRALLVLFWVTALFGYYGTRLGWIPERLHYGDGMFRFASDSMTYRQQAVAAANALREGSLAAFADLDVFLYSKALGLLFFVFGDDPLAGMLGNAVFYMTVLISVYVLTRTLFDERTGVIAVWIAGLWPTFLIHQTQTIRWAMTSAAICVMLTAAVVTLGNGRIGRVLVVAALAYPILLYDVPYMARLLYMGLIVFAAILLVLGLRWRRYPTRALRTLVLAAVLFAAYQAMFGSPPPSPTVSPLPSVGTPAPAPAPSSSYVQRLVEDLLRERRSSMREELRGHAMNFVDAAELHSFGDIVLNLPAAYLAAIFAPSPTMVLGGPEGISGARRYLFGEMLVYYLLLPFVAAGVILTLRQRRFFLRVQALFLGFFIVIIYGLLGTVVTNAGSLQRLRLPYVIVQLAFAAGAIRVLWARWVVEPFPTPDPPEETWHPIAEVALSERG